MLGIAGSLVGGFLGHMLFRSGNSLVQPSSWIGSIISAVIILTISVMIKRRAYHDTGVG